MSQKPTATKIHRGSNRDIIEMIKQAAEALDDGQSIECSVTNQDGTFSFKVTK